jgi:hypothetical protein
VNAPLKSVRSSRWRRWWVAGVLCVIAAAAIGITIPAALHLGRQAPTAGPSATALAPGSAALSNQQLEELLPKSVEFPPSWTVTFRPSHGEDRFTYMRTPSTRRGPYLPTECEDIQVDPTGTVNDVEVSGRDPANRDTYPGSSDIRLGISRAFNPAGFDAMISRTARCAHFGFGKALALDLTVLQNSRSASGLRIFRFSVTSTDLIDPSQQPETEFSSYAMGSALIVSADSTHGHQHELDSLFDSIVARIESH